MFTGQDAEVLAIPRPKKRGECIDGPRPCPWASCRHHLLLDVSEVDGKRLRPPSLRLNGRSANGLRTHADVETVRVWTDEAVERLQSMRETCSLDVADDGRHRMREVASLLAVRRQRVVQEVAEAKIRMAEAVREEGVR